MLAAKFFEDMPITRTNFNRALKVLNQNQTKVSTLRKEQTFYIEKLMFIFSVLYNL